jgi:chromate transporter
MVVVDAPPAASATTKVAFGEAFRFWLKLGFINFGGPAGQIAIMHRELVEEKRWVPERVFLRALNFSMLLPGPEATELAIYVAWRMHGIPGGIVAGTFFVLPSVLVLLLLSWLTVAYTGGAEMVRGLGLAESTPGSLIMVTEYVGFVAAWKNAPADMSRTVYATLGALITVYATFLPTFLYIFIGAPYVEWLSGNSRLRAALTGVTAAVVGVIANLGVFFAVHVLMPESGGFDVFAAVIAVVSLVVLRRFAPPTYWLVPIGAIAGMFWVLLKT